MTIHKLQDLCYAYRVADPVREMLFALQDRIDALEAQKLQDRNAMDAMKLANEPWTQECRRLKKQLIAQRKPLTIAEVEQILAQHDYELHGDRVRYIVRMTEEAHGIKEGT